MQVCPKCQTPLVQGMGRCARCGFVFMTPRPPVLREFAPGSTAEKSGLIQVVPGSHSVGIAILASIALTGFGQFYNKQMGKGVLVLILGILLILGCLGKAFSDWLAAFGYFAVGALLIILLATLDAALIATKLNRGEAVRKWQCF